MTTVTRWLRTERSSYSHAVMHEHAQAGEAEFWCGQMRPLTALVPPTGTTRKCQRCLAYLANAAATFAEIERVKQEQVRQTTPPCTLCGGPHPFDTSLPSQTWNRVVRSRGLPEYLCTTCIVRIFAEAGVSFTAELWSTHIEAFNGLPITVTVGTTREQVEHAAILEAIGLVLDGQPVSDFLFSFGPVRRAADAAQAGRMAHLFQQAACDPSLTDAQVRQIVSTLSLDPLSDRDIARAKELAAQYGWETTE